MPENDNKPSLAGAIALIVIGLLILVPSGLCTGIGVISVLLNLMRPGSGGAGSLELVMFLSIGGPFVLGGGVLLWSGIWRMRARAQKPPRRDIDAF